MTRTLSPFGGATAASSAKNVLASSMVLNIFQFPATVFMLISFRGGIPVRPQSLFILSSVWRRRWQSLCPHSGDSLSDNVCYGEKDAGTLDLVAHTGKASDFRQHQPRDSVVVFTRQLRLKEF